MKSATGITRAPASAKNSNDLPQSSIAAGRRLRPRATPRVRPLLADDHPVVRRGIVSRLKRHANLEVGGDARDGEEAMGKAKELTPDVLLTDIDMPHMTSLAVAEALHKDLPQIKVLRLSMHNSAEFVLRCTKSGAIGYILKQASLDELLRAIETVIAGQLFFSPDVARMALKQMIRGKEPGPNASDLPNRKREVLTPVAEGLCNKEIACRLNIGTSTVETHRERLMRKLDIHSIAGLTKFAITQL